jgi:hypothetical protein
MNGLDNHDRGVLRKSLEDYVNNTSENKSERVREEERRNDLIKM